MIITLSQKSRFGLDQKSNSIAYRCQEYNKMYDIGKLQLSM